MGTPVARSVGLRVGGSVAICPATVGEPVGISVVITPGDVGDAVGAEEKREKMLH